ncbi:hypothetical protein ABKN59_009797 [Abortiporus biennis]
MYATKLRSVQDTLQHKRSFSCGTLPVSPENLVLYYGRHDEEKACRLDFHDATIAEISSLADACDNIASSYCKTGKLDASFFSSTFDIKSSGLLDVVGDEICHLEGEKFKIIAKIYELAVYGQSSFSKPQKEVAEEESHFGSLFIFYSTNHQGGDLVLQDDRYHLRYNFSDALSSCQKPSLGYAAFPNVVDHEIAEVTHGYLVALKYKLYLRRTPSPSNSHLSWNSDYSRLQKALRALLEDPTFLPEGGFIGFGLQREYPFRKSLTRDDEHLHPWERPQNYKFDISFLENHLKGDDSIVMRVCQDLSLSPSLKVAMKERESDSVLFDGLPDLSDENFQDYPAELILKGAYDGKVIDSDWGQLDMQITWITALESRTMSEESVVRFGNEPWMTHLYAHVCLVAKVKPLGSRVLTP